MKIEEREKMIVSYIKGYNQFNTEQMVKDFSEDIVFENRTADAVTLETFGLEEFTDQADKAKEYFSKRKQFILEFKHSEHQTEIELSYVATLAKTLSNNHQKGSKIRTTGKSIFTFLDGKITNLIDIG